LLTVQFYIYFQLQICRSTGTHCLNIVSTSCCSYLLMLSEEGKK